ncbi:MAG: hypothetical protein H6868_07825 [Rhodospirillales bacterium]|nr:hypothetical protein [Rhodospirillales bacterium]
MPNALVIKIGLISVLLIIAALAMPAAISGLWAGRIENALAENGFATTSIGKSSVRKGRIVIQDIALDPDRFSTMDNLSVVTPLLKGIFTPSTSTVTIDGLALSGEWTPPLMPDISGWDGRLPPLPSFDKTVLNSGQADILTTAGALRLNAKGQLTRTPEKSTFEAALWGKQHQLNLDSLWKGTIAPDGSFQVETEIREARLNTDRLQATRVNGWGSLSRQAKTIPVISGQLDAGQIDFSGTIFSKVTLTVDGPIDGYHLIASGQAAGFQNLSFYADVKKENSDFQIDITVLADDVEGLLAFLLKIRNSMEGITSPFGAFSRLMITPGNLARLKATMKDWEYDHTELQIKGPLSDLTSKIVATNTQNNATEQYVISLNPAE